jgi:hypothetical protein
LPLGSHFLQSVLCRMFKMARLRLHHRSNDRPADYAHYRRMSQRRSGSSLGKSPR